MLTRKRLMNDWFFTGAYVEGMEKTSDVSGFEQVSLPHNTVDLPYNYFDENVYQKISCYKKILPSFTGENGSRAVLRFEAVMAVAKVWLDGVYLGEHFGGYTPFEFDVTDYLKTESPRCLTVVADATERPDVPPFGGQIDYLTYSGIYREVYVDTYAQQSIRNVRVSSPSPLAQNKKMDIEVYTENFGESCSATLSVTLTEKSGKTVAEKTFPVEVSKNSGMVNVQLENITGAELWSLEEPVLYTVSCSLKPQTGSIDTFTTRFGFRTAEFRPDGFYLNGENVKIRGLNRHQSWPYVGYAMPMRAQIRDAEILKNELNVNLVRTSHYPQSIEFLDRCDELGLLVFEEIPGWQHIGPSEWKDTAVKNVEEMIVRDWNHPSIIIWGVRINESIDDDEFYSRTNKLARRLDPHRQTGGVRYIDNSSFLEDVYTMNDFVHSGGEVALRAQEDITGLGKKVPYLVTEYNGHMFPTKKFDCEERQNEHVLRHLRVQNASYGDPSISGAIGWCAFDYNTHKDFGSGDRICYHGVMDMFRLPKFAASVYASQVAPEKKIVLKPVTFWARGERSIGGVFPLVVLTNCDSISIQFGTHEPIVITEKEASFSHLPNPPFVIDTRQISMEKIGAWGMRWEDLTLTGFIQGKEVAVVRMPKDPLPSTLSVVVDDPKLCKGEKDVSRVTVSVLDQYGNILPLADPVVSVEITGPARIQGPQVFALKGGASAFWVETHGEEGEVNVTVSTPGFDTQAVGISVL